MMEESVTTSRSTDITSPNTRTTPENADGTGLSSTPNASCAPACMTHRSPSDTMNALSALPRRSWKMNRSATTPASPTVRMARARVAK